MARKVIDKQAAADPSVSAPLITKYRPSSLDTILGQSATVASIRTAIKKGPTPHAWLFTGPSGCGKTTLARIVAGMVGCAPNNVLEIDAATNSGIDAMREVSGSLRYLGFGDSSVRAVILDECFQAGTLVDTPSGPKPIESVIRGDVVNNATGTGHVVRRKETRVHYSRIVKVCVKNRLPIICSEDHPFLTPYGWVKAKDLYHAECIFLSKSCVSRQLLKMWDSLHEQGRWYSVLQRMQNEDLPGVQNFAQHAQQHMLPGVRVCGRGEEAFLSSPGGMAEEYEGRTDCARLVPERGSRQVEGGEAAGAWLVCVESVEYVNRQRVSDGAAEDQEGSGAYQTFYDLEVDTHPSFSVEGLLVHNCHALSAQAWQSLLKVLEEPPAHAYFMLCTTNPGKVPQTALTRCASYQVRELVKDDVWDLLERVCKDEGFKTGEDVLRVIVGTADGSARRALSALQMVHDCEDAKEAALLLSQPFEDAEVVELLRAMVSGARLDWAACVAVLAANKDADPEGLRLMIVNYLSAVLLNVKDVKRAGYLLDCLAQFMRPAQRSEKMAGLLLAFGNLALPH